MNKQIILDKIKSTISEYNMLGQGDRVVVATSGGPDSVALLHILQKLAGAHNLTLWVAHLNHGLRGEEAEKDALFVKKIADKWGLPVIIEKIEVAKRRKSGCSIEEKAREIRYDFLGKVAEKVAATKIALGHQADDNIETILMWLIRGCGPQGFKGIPPTRQINSKYPVQIIRPLIRIAASEICHYLTVHNLDFRTDTSNLKKVYLRNKIRLELLPELSEYNPQIRDSLENLSRLWQRDDDCLTQIALKTKQKVMLENGGINITTLASYHKAIQSRILKMAIEEIKGDTKGISYQQIEAILDLISRPGPQRKLDLAGKIEVVRVYNRLVIQPKAIAGGDKKKGFKTLITVPGQTENKKFWIKTQILSAIPGPHFPPDSSKTAYLDYNKLDLPLIIRNRRPGDRFQPCGLEGSKKIKDFFIDVKLPLSQRDEVPLIADKNKIVWVVGYRIDERVKVTTNTKTVLEIKIE